MGARYSWGRLLGWGPIVTFALVGSLAYSVFVISFERRLGRHISQPEKFWFIGVVVMIIWSYVTAIVTGAGTIAPGWAPSEAALLSNLKPTQGEGEGEGATAGEEKPKGPDSAEGAAGEAPPPALLADAKMLLQWCPQCKAFKPPRAHHCRQCGNCSIKMDHHCPWINNCVGHANQKAFLLFVSYACIGTLHTAIIQWGVLVLSWNTGPLTLDNLLRYLTQYTICGAFFGAIFGIAVAICTGCLAYDQMDGITHNMTQVEEYILSKARARLWRLRHAGHDVEPLTYPYDVGKRRNWRLVFGSRFWLWPLPIPSGEPADAGRFDLDDEARNPWWPVAEGCCAFDLTVEQLAQKREKRDKSVMFLTTGDYDGRLLVDLCCPYRVCCRFGGCQALMGLPDPMEKRLRIRKGQRVRVSKKKDYWLYGKLIDDGGEGEDVATDERYVPRGWFPSCLAERIAAKQTATVQHDRGTAVLQEDAAGTKTAAEDADDEDFGCRKTSPSAEGEEEDKDDSGKLKTT